MLRWPKSVTTISVCSRQFQFAQGNFNLPTAISICSRQFQFTHGNFNFTYGHFNLLTAISILLTAISIYSRQFRNFTQDTFNFFTATLTAFFASLTTCQLQPLTVALHQTEKVKTQNQFKSIFKEKSENHKSKVDLRTSLY